MRTLSAVRFQAPRIACSAMRPTGYTTHASARTGAVSADRFDRALGRMHGEHSCASRALRAGDRPGAGLGTYVESSDTRTFLRVLATISAAPMRLRPGFMRIRSDMSFTTEMAADDALTTASVRQFRRPMAARANHSIRRDMHDA